MQNGGFDFQNRRSLYIGGLVNCALFMGHGGGKGGRCRVLLYRSFKTAQ